MDEITAFLKASGPSLSSDVAAHLCRKGLAAAAARKRIQRANTVHRLWLHFPHRERFLFLDGQDQTPQFGTALLSAFDSTGSVYGTALRSLEARGGICALDVFHVASGAPSRLKGQIPSELVLQNLEILNLVERTEVPGIGTCVKFGTKAFKDPLPHAAFKARTTAENILITATRNWARNLGFVSFNAVKARPEKAEFAKFRWDLVGPSYLRPIANMARDGGNGFFVADVTTAEIASIEQLGYFVRKAAIIRAQKKLRPFMAMLVADNFAREAWLRGRAEGILVTTPQHLFGEAVARGLRELIDTLSRAAAAVAANPDKVWDLFSKLAQIEGAAGNLRGPLFEMIVGHCVGALEGGTIDIGRQAIWDGRAVEIDVYSWKPDHVRCYECRGHAPGHIVARQEVETWCSQKVPTMRNWVVNRIDRPQTPMTFGYWTTGKFAPDALEFLERRRQATNKYTIEWKDGPAVLAYAKRSGSRRVVDTLNEHYFRHPLAHDVRGLTPTPPGSIQAANAQPPALPDPSPLIAVDGQSSTVRQG